MYIGIAVSSAYRLEREATLQPGESVALGDVRFQYGQLTMAHDAQKTAITAEMTVFRKEKQIAEIFPEKRFYGEGEDSQMTTEIGLHSSLKDDIYVILAGWKEDQAATFTFILHPLILWIWIGGFFMFTLGMLVAILPETSAKHQDEQAESES